jgi:membrane protease YdiL (CAAX protease family)
LTMRLISAAIAVAVVALASSYAFRLSLAGHWQMWTALLAAYLPLTAVALVRLSRAERLRPLLGLKRGDPSLGILIGLAMLFAAWLVAKNLLPPDRAERAWLLSIFLLPGELSGAGATLALLALVCCEELVWRGWIQGELREALGLRRGWIVAAVAYSAAHLPTLLTLEDPAAGKNPLVVVAALGCGLCFGFLAERTGRLLPGALAHAVFSYFAATSFWLFI